MPKKPTYEELEQAESEHKRIEKSLWNDLINFQLLFEKAPLGYQSLDENGNLIAVNQAWIEVLGYSHEEVIGKSFCNFLHPDWKDHFKENFPRFKAVGEILGAEFEMVKKDGSFILVSFNGKIGKDKHGGFQQTHCIFQNITEKKRLEEALRKSEEKLKDFIHSAPLSFMLSDLDLNIIKVNKRHMEMFHPEMDPDDLIGKNLLEVFPNSKETGRFDEFMKVIETGIPFYYDDFFSHQKLGNKYLAVKAFKMAEGLGIIIVDITERRQFEKRQQFQKDFAFRLSKPTTLTKISKEILSTVLQLDEFDSGGIYLFDEKTDGLDLIENQGLPQNFVKKVTHYDSDDIRLQMIMRGGPFYQPVSELPEPIREDLEIDGMLTLAVIPIKFRGKVIGSINLASHTHEVISVYSMCTLEAIAEIDLGASIYRVIAEEALNKTNERLEKKVKIRTAELEEKNIALKVLLDQLKNDRKKMEKTIMSNIMKLIRPNLARLKRSALNDRQKSGLALLEANLNAIILPFESSLSSELLKLTPTEIQVLNFIKQNATSKEIADSLGISRKTIETHRQNIRKKIGIRGKGINLKTHLDFLTEASQSQFN